MGVRKSSAQLHGALPTTWPKKLIFSCLTFIMVVGALEGGGYVSHYLIYGSYDGGWMKVSERREK